MRKFKHQYTELVCLEQVNDTYFIKEFNCFIPKSIIENSKDWVEIFEPKFKNWDVIKVMMEQLYY